MKITEVTIIGTGKVGGALAQRLKNKGLTIHAVAHSGYDSWLESDTPLGQVVVLAVKDAALKNIIVDIETHRMNDLKDVVVMHVNGSLGRDVLHLLETDGAIAVAAHPFQTFSDDDPSALDLIGWGIDATDDGWKVVKAFVETLGGIPVRLKDTSDAGKRRYHAAAVAASNFAYAAYELGRQLADNAGLDPVRFLVPIMQRTFENAADALHDDEQFGVTGPLVRGDTSAVEQQLRALPEDLRPMYRHLSLALLEVKSLNLTGEQKAEMKDLLSRQIDD